MLKTKFFIAMLAIFFSTLLNMAKAVEEPQVKKSKSGICHAKGTSYYNQTKNYTAYNSLEECIKAGGRTPKR
jgi:hypothetical protein